MEDFADSVVAEADSVVAEAGFVVAEVGFVVAEAGSVVAVGHSSRYCPVPHARTVDQLQGRIVRNWIYR